MDENESTIPVLSFSYCLPSYF